MYRYIISFILLMFLFISHAAASDLSIKRDYYNDQMIGIKELMTETEDKAQLIYFSREYNRLAAHKRAYDKAIELSFIPTSFKTTMFIGGTEQPGELAYKQIYRDAADHYNIDWAILAAIHDMETTFSTHPTMISSAGALGHMQFMPGTWDYYGVDADGDGKADPFNLVDAIYSAANYLAATGAADGNIKKALFAYNRSTQYGLDVMARADKYRTMGGNQDEY